MRVLMLTDDVFQLDRRIVHEAASLAGPALGARCAIYGIHSQVPRPVVLPDSVEWLGSSRGGELAGTARVLRNLAWSAAGRIGLTGFLQGWSCRLRDPARRRVPALIEAIPQRGYDLIVAHDLPTLPLALALRARQPSSCKVVLDAHELF